MSWRICEDTTLVHAHASETGWEHVPSEVEGFSRGVCFLVLLWHDWVCGICMTSVSLWSAKVFMSYRQKYTGIHTDFSCLDHRCLYLGGFFDGIACHLRAEDIRAFGLEILLLQSTHSNFHGKNIAFCCWSHRRVRRVQLCLREIGSILACTCRDLIVHCQVQGSPPDSKHLTC